MAELIDFAIASFWAGDPQPLIDHVRNNGLQDTSAAREVMLHLLAGKGVPESLDGPNITTRLERLNSALLHQRLFDRRTNLEAVYRTVAAWEGAEPDSIKRWAVRNARAKLLIDQHKRLVRRLPLKPWRWWRLAK